MLKSFAYDVLRDLQLRFCNKNRAKLLSNVAERLCKDSFDARIRSNTHIVTFQEKTLRLSLRASTSDIFAIVAHYCL